MSEDFNPYYKWLAIPPAEQPPNFYRLLSLPLYETDQEVIAAAAVQRINWLRNFESGANGELAKQIKEELSAAWMCLRNADHKRQYDEQLRRNVESRRVAGPQVSSTLFAEAVAGARPARLDRFEVPTARAEIQRAKRSKSSGILGILLQASAGPIGLVLGYLILCQIGPQYDFLGVWHAKDSSKSSAAAVSQANQEVGWPNQKAAPKPFHEKPRQLAIDEPTKPTPAPATTSAASSSKIDSEPIEVATRSPVAEPGIPSGRPPSEEPEKNNTEPSESASEADPAGAATPNASASKIPFATVAELQKAIAKFRTAGDVMQLLRAARADTSILEETRSYANSQLPVWEDRAANDCVRLGDVWMPRAAAKAAREKANDLLVQAAGLLSLDNDQSALERLQDAARVDPEATSANFLLGVHYALGLKNYQEAKVYFNNCLRRRPDDAGALNNLALASVMLGKYADGLKIFRMAVDSNSRSPEIAHNLRKILKQDGLKILPLPPAMRKGFVDLLTGSINDETVIALDNFGWLYMLPAGAPAFEGLPAEAPNVLLRFVQAKTDKTVKVHARWIEDCQCLWCLGAGKVPCPNSECAKGKVTVITGQQSTGSFDLITMKPQYRNITEVKDCPVCHGKGSVACDKCTGKGTDPAVSGIRLDASK